MHISRKFIYNHPSILFGLLLLIFSAVFILVSTPTEESKKQSFSTVKAESENLNFPISSAFLPKNPTCENPIQNISDLIRNDKENVTDDSPNLETNTESTDTVITDKDYESLIDFDNEYPFMIKINRGNNFATIYGIDFDGHYSIPYKTFICSTGLDPDNTPLGVYRISDKYRWRLMVDGSYAQYAVRIFDQVMLHSVPYYSQSSDTLEYEEYNKLGSASSLGCVRFQVADIKWIYDNCPEETLVVIYDDTSKNPPIKLKNIKKIKATDPRSGWDPSDPDESNPWNMEN